MGTHLPAFGPMFAHPWPAGQVLLKHGSWQPFWPLQTQTGAGKQFAPIVPLGAQMMVLLASFTVWPAQFTPAHGSAMQRLPSGIPVWLSVTISQDWPLGQGNSPGAQGAAHWHAPPAVFMQSFPALQRGGMLFWLGLSFIPLQSLSSQSHDSGVGPWPPRQAPIPLRH
jgi:hypothetical protein